MLEIHVIAIDLDVYCIDVPNVLLFSFALSHSTARGVKDNKCCYECQEGSENTKKYHAQILFICRSYSEYVLNDSSIMLFSMVSITAFVLIA